MEDAMNSAALWNLKLIRHDPYLLADLVGFEKPGLEIFCSTSFDRSLPVQLEP
jgi:hypothetical protein